MSNVHDTGCTLKWEEPKDDGGLPIKEYEIEKMDLATGKWIRCGKVSCGHLIISLSNVMDLFPQSVLLYFFIIRFDFSLLFVLYVVLPIFDCWISGLWIKKKTKNIPYFCFQNKRVATQDSLILYCFLIFIPWPAAYFKNSF